MRRANWDKALAAYLARPPSEATDPRAVTVARVDPVRTYVVISLAQFLVSLREQS